MSVRNHFHLYLDDYVPEGSSNLRGRLFLNNQLETTSDLRNLLTSRLCGSQDFDAQWRPLISASRDGEESVLHVHGSEFARLFFSAISRNTEAGVGRFSVADDSSDVAQDPKNGSTAPFDVIGGSFSDRLETLRRMGEKYGIDCELPKRILLAVGDEVSDADGIASALNAIESFSLVGINVETVSLGEAPDEAFIVPIVARLGSDIPWKKVASLNNILFLYNQALIGADDSIVRGARGKMGDSCYMWRFSSREALVRAVEQYVITYFVIPAMSDLFVRIADGAASRITLGDLFALKRAVSVLPFYCVIVPSAAVVDREEKLLLHHEGLPPASRSGVTVEGAQSRLLSESASDMSVVFTPQSLEDVVIRLTIENDICGNASDEWGFEHFILKRVPTGAAVEKSRETRIPIRNHGLTTNCMVSVDGKFVEGISERPVGDDIEIGVVARNRFSLQETPQDAADWKYTLSGSAEVVCRETGDGASRHLVVTPHTAGSIGVRFHWEGPEHVTSEEVAITAISRAKSLCYEITTENGQTSSAVRINRDKRGNSEVFCYPYDTLKIRAWVEGDGVNLWEPRVDIPGVVTESWSDPAREVKISYRSVGVKFFKIKAVDSNVTDEFTVTCNVLANHSLTARRVMVIAFVLALFHAWLVYGLNLWCFLVYSSPIATYAFYKAKKCPLYAKTMFLLLLGGILIFVRALWQEVS